MLFLLIALLTPFFILCETAITPYITSEDNTLALVDNIVNVENGRLVQIDREISIRGSDPFVLTRYYDNGHDFDSEFGYGMGVSLPVDLMVGLHIETENLAIQERIGSYLLFDAKPIKGKKGEFSAVVNRKIFSMGYTNCCQAQIRGEPSAHSTRVWGNEKFCIVTLGDGTKRHYHFYKKDYKLSHYRLVQEDRPNGNKRYFNYYHPDWTIVTSIETRDKTGSLVLYRIDFSYTKSRAWINASNGQSVNIYKKELTGKAKGRDGKKYLYPAWVVKNRTASHLPTREYENKEKTDYVCSLFSLLKISEGNGRNIDVEYDKYFRVKNLFFGGKLHATFDYNTNSTTVRNAHGHERIYNFSSKRLVKLTEPHKTQSYEWDHRGQLLRHEVFDPKGTFVHERTYAYDPEGRIVVAVVDGEITQKGARDRYGIEYTYSGDELHLLEKEVHHFDTTYSYSYLPGTNLRTSKISSKNNVVYDSEFYGYDLHGFLISAIHDDGACQKITEILPESTAGHPGLSQPKIIREFYIDSATGKRQLLKKTERVYGKGDLLIEERIFDANDQFAYSKKWAYNDREELIAETNALGQVTRYEYDVHGNKIYEEKNGSSKRFTYDIQNNLIEEVERHGSRDFQTVHTYDPVGNRIVTRDRYCKTTWFHYDGAGRVVRKQDPYAYEEAYELDTEGRITRKSDKEGHVTETRYNLYGSPLEILHPDGSSEHFRYDIEGHLVEKTDRDGTLEKHLLDERGRPIKIETYSSEGTLLKTLRKEYKGLNLVCEIDALGYETRHEYDGAGRKIKTIEGELITQYRYDSLGRLSHTITPLSVEVKLYDVLDRVIEERIEDANGQLFHKVEYAYDVFGNRTETKTYTSESDCTISKELYDTQNRITHKIDPEGALTEILYHETDHLEVETVDPLGRRTVEVHGACDEVREKRTYSPSGEILASALYEYNRLHKKILHKEKVFGASITPYEYVIEFAYDAMGQKTIEKEGGLRTTTFAYDRGRLATLTKADGTSLQYRYDSLGRLSSLTSTDGTVDDYFTYDAADNCLTAKNRVAGTMTERKYDRHQNLIYEKQASGFEMNYSYDALGRLLATAFLDEQISYTYSPKALLTATRFHKGKPIYTYRQKTDFNGKLIENSCLGNEVAYSWNKRGALTAIKSPVFKESYTYDGLGRMITQGDSHFTYDDLDQLIEEKGIFDHTYAYDSLYNRRIKDGSFAVIDPLNQVTSQGSDLYRYDSIGRRTSKGVTTYTYDALGRLLTLKGPEGDFHFGYDAYGRRIFIEENGKKSHFLYQFDAEIARYNGTLQEFRALIGKDSPFAIEIGGTVYFPLRNYRGDIVQLLTAKGTLFAACTYDSFGVESPSHNFTSPWRFCGRRSFAGLLHFDKRDYDPALGRWLTPDPLGLVDGPNLYVYVKNSPHLYIDPYGLFLAEARDFSHGMFHGFAEGMSFGTYSSFAGNYQATTPYGSYGIAAGNLASFATPIGLESALFRSSVRASQLAVKAIRTEQSLMKYAQAERSIVGTAKMISTSTKESAAFHKVISFPNSCPKNTILSSTKNRFPSNPNNLLKEIPRDARGHIYTSDRIRIRPEKHELLLGEIFNPRHHGQHYHVDTKIDQNRAWKSNNIHKIKPNNYSPGEGSGFLPGELFPGIEG